MAGRSIPVEARGCQAGSPGSYLCPPRTQGWAVHILSVVVGKVPVKDHTGRASRTSSLDWGCIPAVLHMVAAAAAADLGNHRIFLPPGLAAAAAMEWNILLLEVGVHRPKAAAAAGPG